MGRPSRPRQPWGNRRRHQDAERVATPQWRSLGPVLVEVCADRLLVHQNGKPGTVWLASVTDVLVDAEHEIVDLFFERDAPFRFQGPDVSYLAQQLVQVSWTLTASTSPAFSDLVAVPTASGRGRGVSRS